MGEDTARSHPTMDDYVINAAYVISTLALAVRDVLRLRVLLLGAQLCFLVWGILIGHTPTQLWNGLFLLINAAMVGRLLWERRPIELPEELHDIYRETFQSMAPRDFLTFWEMGDPHQVEDVQLVEQGQTPDGLQMVLAGTAEVHRGGRHVADITRGTFVAEMSFLTGQPANADVHATGVVGFVSWSRRKLSTLHTVNPSLYLEFQKALSRDLSRKAIEEPPEPDQ